MALVSLCDYANGGKERVFFRCFDGIVVSGDGMFSKMECTLSKSKDVPMLDQFENFPVLKVNEAFIKLCKKI